MSVFNTFDLIACNMYWPYNQTMQYVFHHVPKCAGSTLQSRMIMHEHLEELPSGSVCVKYNAVGKDWIYTLKDDPDYNPKDSLHEQTFARHRGHASSYDLRDVTIYMGHAVDHTYEGEHWTWIRNPWERDISHYNYDWNHGRINKTYFEWQMLMPPNWICEWLHTKYLGLPVTDDKTMYETIKASNLKIRSVDTLEEDYKHICSTLNLKPLDVKDNVQDNKIVSRDDFGVFDIEDHKIENMYDWMLYENIK